MLNNRKLIMSIFADLFRTSKFIVKHPLNLNYKVEALLKFFKWQLSTRLLRMKVIIPWVDDCRFVAGVGETGLTGNIYAGFTEYQDMSFLLHALQPTEVFVDVGANIGAYTILASKVLKAKSISFEPLPETVERLKDQIHINRIQNMVEIKNMGVGDKIGPLFFTNTNDTINKVSVIGEAKNTTRVDVVTLDGQLNTDVQYFLKIDVEGFEYNVLEGASRLLSSDQISAIIIELNGSGEEFGHSNEEIHNKLISFEFIPVSYDPISRHIRTIDSYNRDCGNTIYVKNLKAISDRCKLAPKRTIHTAFGIEI